MKIDLVCFRGVCLIAAALAGAGLVQAQTDVLTWHNDLARTGLNPAEVLLTPGNVSSANFGLLANVVVDGKVDAQPLYVSALTMSTPGTSGTTGTHNVLFIATEHDSVYAVDADSGTVYWKKSMLGTGEATSDDRNCGQVVPEIGITATPVIDRLSGPHGTIYLVAMSKNGAGSYFQRIHALDLTTGLEEFSGPVVVQATYSGTGDGSANGVVTFDAKQYKERPALLLLNGEVYTSWGSHCDIRPYAGWMMAYNEKTLAQTAVLNFDPNGYEAAPWNAGAGPAADASGNVYLALGNGLFDTTLNAAGMPGMGDYGNSLVKLLLKGNQLTVLDYWTMYDSDDESHNDTDLGSGGYMLLPDLADSTGKLRHLSVGAGKDGNLYVADRDKMGHYDATTDGTIYQQVTGGLPGGVWSSPAYFDGRVFYGPVGGQLRAFEIAKAKLGGSAAQTTETAFGYPGTTPSVSAYGTAQGIVWATENSNPAVLHAYDAGSLSTELYNSNQTAGGRDQFGVGNKFIAPTIANGKVYVGTTNSVAIFGFIRHVAPVVADGIYQVVNQNSKLALDDPGGSLASGTVLWQYAAGTQARQKWFFASNGNGYYTIQNVGSRLFLIDPYGSTTVGTLVEQGNPTYADGELWSLTQSGSGWVIKNKKSGLAMDDLAKTTEAGPHVGVSKGNGASDEVWMLK